MATARLDWRKMAAAACLHVDWSQVAFAALGSAHLADLVCESLKQLGRRLEIDALALEAQASSVTSNSDESPAGVADAPNDHTPLNEAPSTSEDDTEEQTADEQSATKGTVAPAFFDPKALRAAALLGVDVGASEDAIRAALRARLSSSRLHPDQGGDGEEATNLIAAKNLLTERLRAMRP